MIAASLSGPARSAGNDMQPEVVEVSLLLTSRRLDALLMLARTRGESVGQILRGLIDEAVSKDTLVG